MTNSLIGLALFTLVFGLIGTYAKKHEIKPSETSETSKKSKKHKKSRK
jgi:hypothetical protein